MGRALVRGLSPRNMERIRRRCAVQSTRFARNFDRLGISHRVLDERLKQEVGRNGALLRGLTRRAERCRAEVIDTVVRLYLQGALDRLRVSGARDIGIGPGRIRKSVRKGMKRRYLERDEVESLRKALAMVDPRPVLCTVAFVPSTNRARGRECRPHEPA